MRRRLQKKILIVDDEIETCNLIAAYLNRQKGYRAYEAYDGAQAVAVIKKLKPDLIILDVVMPVMDGFELLKILKNKGEYSKIPVIMLTIKSDPKNLDRGISLETDFYLPKPLNLDNLMNFVKLTLEN